MRGTLNVHKTLKGAGDRSGYVDALDLVDDREQSLRDARDCIRQALRREMPEWNILAKSIRLVEGGDVALASALPPLRPKFRMQGSSVYHTINFPAHTPPQEVDYDDGVFLPTSFVSRRGSNRPMVAAKSYFEMVEAILEPLCARNGWKLDTSKRNCVRVRIDPAAHVDLALYAIPDKEFAQLAEARATARLAKGISAADSEYELAEEVYRDLLAKRIMLARRDSGWIESDPREMEDWFVSAAKEHGRVLRRVCRYLKGWRDYQWRKGGPSSIALMACVVTVFDELDGTLPDNRDDLALKAVADRLDELFSHSIPNPVLPDQDLDGDWSSEERLDFKARAVALKAMIDNVLNKTFHKKIAISQLQRSFGERVPDDEQLIEIETEERRVLAHQPAVVAAPFVPRTTSG